MIAKYIGIIDKDKTSEYGIRFPDFPGCISAGESIDEVFNMGTEALAFHVEGIVEDREDIPVPSKLEEIKADSENVDAAAFVVVPVEIPESKTKRINITLPEFIIKRTDRFAKRRRLTRSKVIADALLTYSQN